MPWKETCAVDERLLMITEYRRGEARVSELCRRYGVSRKTGHKWIARFEEEGVGGLLNRSHAPHNCEHRLDEALEQEIILVRQDHPTWGPKKILSWLKANRKGQIWPALSTIGAVLDRAGLTVHRKRRSRIPASAPFGACSAANDVWTVDFKGWFRTGDGERCDPLTLKDAYSRYLLRCQAVERPDFEAVWPIFDAAFREFGLPKAMRSDNGPPFASRSVGGLTRLSVRLIKAGVIPERIEPGKPQQNGRHERFHLTLKNETADPPAAHRRAQQQRFDDFRQVYNEERPHEALGQTPPLRHFTLSPRPYSGKLRTPDYPDCFEIRRVRHNGEIKWNGEMIFVSTVLVGENVGCEETEDGKWLLHYGPVKLGILHRGELRVPRRAPRGRSERAAALPA